jgi:hypothetical protein
MQGAIVNPLRPPAVRGAGAWKLSSASLRAFTHLAHAIGANTLHNLIMVNPNPSLFSG